MTTLFIFVNTYFAIIMWRMANRMFEQDHNNLGWVYVAASAANGAAAAAHIF